MVSDSAMPARVITCAGCPAQVEARHPSRKWCDECVAENNRKGRRAYYQANREKELAYHRTRKYGMADDETRRTPMPDHRATYAARFNARGIERPKPPPPPLTDEQFEAWVSTLDPGPQAMHRFVRAMYRTWVAPRLDATPTD